jgi:hypothetical protein
MPAVLVAPPAALEPPLTVFPPVLVAAEVLVATPVPIEPPLAELSLLVVVPPLPLFVPATPQAPKPTTCSNKIPTRTQLFSITQPFQVPVQKVNLVARFAITVPRWCQQNAGMTADQLRQTRVNCEKSLQFAVDNHHLEAAQSRSGRKVGCSRIKGTDSRSNRAEKAS